MIGNNLPIIYVVDDDFAIRDSLTLLLESNKQTVRSFASAESFLNGYSPQQPGCLILDLKMPIMTGHELQNELLKRGIYIPVIFISGNADIADTAKAFKAGAIDFLVKPINNDELLVCINEAIKRDLAYRELSFKKQLIQKRIDLLTVREKEVLRLIINSYSNKEAAKVLNISHRTVDVYRAHIMEKMQAEHVADLIAMVMFCDEHYLDLKYIEHLSWKKSRQNMLRT